MKDPKVVVSLTTHSIRVKNVWKTILSILNGTFKEVKVVLTLYKDDIGLISPQVQSLIDNKIVELIIADKDLGPHLKYFYAMQKYRNLPVVTIDDDVIYPVNMIAELYDYYKKTPNTIIARRCFLITTTPDGKLKSYHDWLSHFVGFYPTPTHKIFATGIGGILYPPNCLGLSDDNISEILGIKYDDDFYLKALEVRRNIKIINICKLWSDLYLKNMTDRETQSIALWYNKNILDSDKNIAKYYKEFLNATK